MVIYRSKVSRSRTSIHGGLRRGAAAAAVGAVLVLSAGVPASQAADGSTDPTEPTQVAVDGNLTGVNGLVKGLLGSSGQQSTASPEPAPAPSGSTAPTATGTPTPGPTSTATTQSAPASSATTPQGTAPLSTAPQGTVPPSSAPAPLGTSPAPGAASPAGAQPNGQPGDPAAATQDAGQAVGPTADQPTQDAHSPNATPVSVPKRPGDAPASRENMASAAEADAGAEPAKVWLGVGLVGSAGAAGLLFARIRRI